VSGTERFWSWPNLRGGYVAGCASTVAATPKVRDARPARHGAMAQIPLGRFGEPAELAGVAAFLLSPAGLQHSWA
jgi:NAD(P)-dependent dehydrogenase (short-subunit alcohol dehydrogenase family)